MRSPSGATARSISRSPLGSTQRISSRTRSTAVGRRGVPLPLEHGQQLVVVLVRELDAVRLLHPHALALALADRTPAGARHPPEDGLLVLGEVELEGREPDQRGPADRPAPRTPCADPSARRAGSRACGTRTAPARSWPRRGARPDARLKPIGPVIQPWNGLPRMRTPKRRTISPVNAPTSSPSRSTCATTGSALLGAGDELEPLARLEDIALPKRVDGGVDAIQGHSLQAQHGLSVGHRIASWRASA